MVVRKSIRAAAALTTAGLASILIIASLLQRAAVTTRESSKIYNDNNQQRQSVRRLTIPEQPTPIVRLGASQEESAKESAFDPSSYAYLLVHYHKTGHHLSISLRDSLVSAGAAPDNPDSGLVSNGRENAFKHRMHEESSGCPRAMQLRPGEVHVQAAPNLFCETSSLAEYLLRNDDIYREKKGVKIVHLVRNPFALAVSNWIYHAQYPTPELWVKSVDPCAEELWFERQSLGDLVGPTLTLGEEPIMRRDDFDAVHEICTDIYQASEESKPWSYYTHLRHLDPRSALDLATAHMMVQGTSGGDILRMANNIVKFNQVQQLEDHIRTSQHLLPLPPGDKVIQVMTLSMEEFTREPRASALRFLDFALGNASAWETKERVASEYEASYYEKLRSGDEHITANKAIENGEGQNIAEQKKEWEEHLRGHKLFGRVLGNIERLVEDALSDSGSNLYDK